MSTDERREKALEHVLTLSTLEQAILAAVTDPATFADPADQPTGYQHTAHAVGVVVDAYLRGSVKVYDRAALGEAVQALETVHRAARKNGGTAYLRVRDAPGGLVYSVLPDTSWVGPFLDHVELGEPLDFRGAAAPTLVQEMLSSLYKSESDAVQAATEDTDTREDVPVRPLVLLALPLRVTGLTLLVEALTDLYGEGLTMQQEGEYMAVYAPGRSE